MTEGEQVLRSILDLANRHDADSIQAYLADNMRFRTPISGDSDASGMHAMHSMLFTAFPDVEYRIARVLTQEQSVVVECTLVGTQQAEFAGVAASGKAIDLPVAFCVDVANGKVQNWRSYFDTATLMRQLGALPEPAVAGAA